VFIYVVHLFMFSVKDTLRDTLSIYIVYTITS